MSEGMSACQQGEFMSRSWTWQRLECISSLTRRMTVFCSRRYLTLVCLLDFCSSSMQSSACRYVFFRIRILGDQLASVCIFKLHIMFIFSCKITVQINVVPLLLLGQGQRPYPSPLSLFLPWLPLFVLRLQDGGKICERIV